MNETDEPAPKRPRRRRAEGAGKGEQQRRRRAPEDAGKGERRRRRSPEDAGKGEQRRRVLEGAGRGERLARLIAARSQVELPPMTYPAELPVCQRRDDIAQAIDAHQVVIVAGETGSGKTTQLPKILLELGRGRTGQIGHTQPRRVAARSVAERIAEELGLPLGGAIGYQVRFTDSSSDGTLVKVMTDGILLAQIQHDPMLWAYDALIIDEAHERSLNIDFILGYLTTLLPRRPDLKVIITSATIDSELFATHFGRDGVPAPVIEVTGRTYPVEIRYRPLGQDPAQAARPGLVQPPPAQSAPTQSPPARPAPASSGSGRSASTHSASTVVGRGTKKPNRSRAGAADDDDQVQAICRAARELMALGPGDILVFCSGEREIRDASDGLIDAFGESIEVLPLYARLSAAEQHRVFEAHARRRIVLATNVAETSLTVPGIHYVIDPGTARISRYSKATKVQRLPIEPISQASANQRAGRCGRVAAGVCVRLYDEDDFAARPEFTEPEILRTSLASVILQMIAVGVAASPQDVASFPFVQRPDARNIRDGVQVLTELGALADDDADGSRPTDRRQTDPGRHRPPVSDDAAAIPDPAVGASATADADPTSATADTGAPGAEATRRRRTVLTPIGRQLAQLPIDPRLARMIVEAGRLDVAREVSIVVAALSIQDPRERPADLRAQADQAHARFADATSDFLTYLNLWVYLREQRKLLSSSAFRRLCREDFLNYLRVREWQDLVTQIRQLAKPLGIRVAKAPNQTADPGDVGRTDIGRGGSKRAGRPGDADPNPRRHSTRPAQDHLDPATRQLLSARAGRNDAAHPWRQDWPADAIHRAILPGLLSQLGMQQITLVRGVTGQAGPGRTRRGVKLDRNDYLGARGARFAIFPGSAVFRKPPAWLMATELVETSRLWGRDVAGIDPDWVEGVAGHLVARTYAEPRWSAKQGVALVTEKVLLFGLPIVPGRPRLASHTDPELARELFIRHALVEGDWRTQHAFFAANRARLEEAEDLATRARRRAFRVDDQDLFDFYDERIPDWVTSARHFDSWWATVGQRRGDLLTLTDEVLGAASQAAGVRDGFPDQWVQGDLRLAVTYHYDPGSDADGVTVHIPIAVANQVRPDGFDWQVPGQRVDLIAALIKALPKQQRVHLVPAVDTARAAAERLGRLEDWVDSAGRIWPITEALTEVFRQMRDVYVPAQAWSYERVPDHLLVTFAVENARGEVMASGHDLATVQNEAAPGVRQAIAQIVAATFPSPVAVELAAQAADDAASVGAAPSPAPSADASKRGVLVPAADAADAAAPVGAAPSPAPIPAPTWGIERASVNQWDFGDIPRLIEAVAPTGATVRGYPALVSQGGELALRVLLDPAAQESAMVQSTISLLYKELALTPGRITTRLRPEVALPLANSAYRDTAALTADVQRTAIGALMADQAGRRGVIPKPGGGIGGHPGMLRPADGIVWNQADYNELREALRDQLEDRCYLIITKVSAILADARAIERRIEQNRDRTALTALADIRSHLTHLLADGFIARAGQVRLDDLRRYLAADAWRLDHLTPIERDQAGTWLIAQLTQEYQTALAAWPPGQPIDPQLEEIPWMIEEFRVSTFAQTIRTAYPISQKRIRQALAATTSR